MLASLLDPTTTAEALGRLRELMGALRTLENAAMHGHAAATQFVHRCCWPAMQWPMELLTALEEAGFRYVPKKLVHEPLVRFFESFSITWIIELAVGGGEDCLEKLAERQVWPPRDMACIACQQSHARA